MAELGSKGVTAGKIASNVQKKLTRAQEKVKGGGSAVARWDWGLAFPEPCAVLQPPALSAAGGGICAGRPAGLGSQKGAGVKGERSLPGLTNAVLLPPGNWAGLLRLGTCSGRL